MADTTETVYVEQGTAPVGRRRRSTLQDKNGIFHSRALLGIETRNSNQESSAQERDHPRSNPSWSWNGTIPILALLVVAVVIGVVAWLYKRSDKGMHSEA